MMIVRPYQRSKRRPTRKQQRNVLLLEVLVALTLVMLCAIPLARSQIALVRHQLATVRDLQLEHHARLAYMRVVEQFYQHNITWKNLDYGCRPQGDLGPVRIKLPNGETDDYSCHYEISIEDKKRKNRRADYRLLNVELTFTPQHAPQEQVRFFYQLFIKRPYEGKTNKIIC